MKRRAWSAGWVLAAVGALMIGGQPAVAAAGTADASKLFPIDPATQLQTHAWLDCQASAGLCNFTVGAALQTPDGLTGFPADLWARQSTVIRSLQRTAYMDVHTAGGEGPWGDRGGPGTKVFKDGGPSEITSLYGGAGPPEKYQTHGTIVVSDLATGQPKVGASVILCTHIQVVYTGVNITGPATCAQTVYE
ncbi:hypothetical protein [Mycolicibacillus koreensis]|uniref:Uncharacterized protein n=1 Tax=Mycolicibacillus koreensis TaxID=1069220 RepID=A0A7I7SJ66_9MYCO|nr:hypothetical protein [Mycolicibacillus koreensis]ODR06130.1 hypothetical protein BHQ15_13930 [Mycolicibacillus koreensis]OSC33344.1 hypothetical protein B8W67_11410 [Mycolicibacillus koreensis]BBY56279.1 hypothetical protein MKOR_35300 [Mycolicibacillus koreensis]